MRDKEWFDEQMQLMESEKTMLTKIEEKLKNSTMNFKKLGENSYSIEPNLKNAGNICMKINISSRRAKIFIDVDKVIEIITPAMNLRILLLLNDLNREILHGTFFVKDNNVRFKYRLFYPSVNLTSQGLYDLIMQLLETIDESFSKIKRLDDY